MKKLIALAFITGTFLAMVPNEAGAAVCARGVHRAGCVGARGAVVTGRGAVAGGRAVVTTRSVHRGGAVYRGRVRR
jgi:hypothetical protein